MKAEKKLKKQMNKLAKTAAKFDKKITKIDKKIRKLPINLSLRYNLEAHYFRYMPGLFISLTKVQASAGAVSEAMEPYQPDGGE